MFSGRAGPEIFGAGSLARSQGAGRRRTSPPKTRPLRTQWITGESACKTCHNGEAAFNIDSRSGLPIGDSAERLCATRTASTHDQHAEDDVLPGVLRVHIPQKALRLLLSIGAALAGSAGQRCRSTFSGGRTGRHLTDILRGRMRDRYGRKTAGSECPSPWARRACGDSEAVGVGPQRTSGVFIESSGGRKGTSAGVVGPCRSTASLRRNRSAVCNA